MSREMYVLTMADLIVIRDNPNSDPVARNAAINEIHRRLLEPATDTLLAEAIGSLAKQKRDERALDVSDEGTSEKDWLDGRENGGKS